MNVNRHRFVSIFAWPIMLAFFLIVIGQPSAQTVRPVPLPDPRIPGFEYPTHENKIVWWTINDDQDEINKHAWGIWTALTLETDQVYYGQKLRVFETWLTPQDLTDKDPSDGPSAARRMEKPRQLHHGGSTIPDMEEVGVHTKYDPTLSAHIRQNNLLSKKHLLFLLMTGINKVPAFPSKAIAIKPVFKVMPKEELVDGRYYQIAAWPGPPGATMDPLPVAALPDPLGATMDPLPGEAKAFPSDSWGRCIWIDVTNKSKEIAKNSPEYDAINQEKKKNLLVDEECDESGSTRGSNNTYNVNNFINFQLSSQEAAYENIQRRNKQKLQGSPTPTRLHEGDYAVLVGMHVSSRETTRWTWQTFWWTPTPDNPNFPSSPEIAKARPAQLKGAARNYALAASYSMVNPPQQYYFGENVGSSVYAYNPWLEAGFGPSDLPDSKPGTYKGKAVPNNVGTQTNCMSCHAQANYNIYSIRINDPPAYTGARYVDMSSPRFNGTLQVDFLWSLPNMAK